MLEYTGLRGRWVRSWTPWLVCFDYFWLFCMARRPNVFPFRFAGGVGGSPNFWFGVYADGFLHGCAVMKTEGASFD